MPETCAKLVRLGPHRLALLAEAAASLGVAIVQVRWDGRRLSRLLHSPAMVVKPAPESESALQQCARIAWAIDVIGRRLPRDPTCLMRALAARAMLSRRGLEGRIRIGISEDSAEFRAHAWVEVGARPVVGWMKNERYTVLAQIS